ncbi:hypothetical protein PSEUDO8AS_40347 [Pseudomonas sp. 8AS]|uniref:hypothetical protein n=1 Tax=Pseudomonas sp. 8AS TaxID=2653163 RepID=UPI0012F2DF28|nr:hypothetical protein [Pseudomonas sp. 8AS]VXB97545.1 hypothetical protein PSEUDO8AS_40347 [Pseudomonas sp. 8AS]
MKITVSIVLSLLLVGCSGIPYDQNKSHAQIASDLKIKEQEIKVISKCNFYPFEYGKKAYAKMRSCVFVENSDSVFIVNYDKDENRYYAEFSIKPEEIHCTAIAKKEPGKGIIYLYAEKNAFTVALLHQNNDLNHEAVLKLEKELISKSIPVLDLSISISNPLYKYKTGVSSVCPLTMR